MSIVAVASLAGHGCGLASPEADAESASAWAQLGTPEGPKLTRQQKDGRKLFRSATFDGNGRTCETCHDRESGTISVEDVQLRFHNPQDPLFRSIDSDIGATTYDRLLAHATVLLAIPLHHNVSIVGSSARTLVVARGVPTVMNTPALDPVLTYDGREPDLQAQARGAVSMHSEPGRIPTDAELEQLADFQTTLFNRDVLRDFASGGPAPELPPGTTASERRGRRFFVTEGFAVGMHPENLCTHCHAGPFLNQSSGFLAFLPEGARFANVRVAELNHIGRPVYELDFHDGLPPLSSPDPGRALITGRRADAGDFKIATLWGIEETAPYFHDNSAKTLEEMMAHYARFFELVTRGAVQLSPQEQADIVAYLELL